MGEKGKERSAGTDRVSAPEQRGAGEILNKKKVKMGMGGRGGEEGKNTRNTLMLQLQDN